MILLEEETHVYEKKKLKKKNINIIYMYYNYDTTCDRNEIIIINNVFHVMLAIVLILNLILSL